MKSNINIPITEELNGNTQDEIHAYMIKQFAKHREGIPLTITDAPISTEGRTASQILRDFDDEPQTESPTRLATHSLPIPNTGLALHIDEEYKSLHSCTFLTATYCPLPCGAIKMTGEISFHMAGFPPEYSIITQIFYDDFCLAA